MSFGNLQPGFLRIQAHQPVTSAEANAFVDMAQRCLNQKSDEGIHICCRMQQIYLDAARLMNAHIAALINERHVSKSLQHRGF